VSAAAERWLRVPGYDVAYEASDLGRVRRLREGGGNRTRTVHALVADAFMGPRAPGLEIDHVDGDKSNCRLSNLEPVTHAENMRRWAERRRMGQWKPWVRPPRRPAPPRWNADDLPWDPAIHGTSEARP